MLTKNCERCGQENPSSARFCLACGTPLTTRAAQPEEERKVVTVLFADLVGFTTRSERMDPEDVRAMLSPYYLRLRTPLHAVRKRHSHVAPPGARPAGRQCACRCGRGGNKIS